MGSDLILTVDSFVQRVAEDALDGQSGAILVLDAIANAILALARAPRIDPKRILDSKAVRLIPGVDSKSKVLMGNLGDEHLLMLAHTTCIGVWTCY